ncbi:hypothetical protein NEMBOFW57_008592 [Staphylotrichum longicolle]|uniref:Uncharacterized protein n=1 Tax=Staphylotrichum longicolle TaxID=669026 RepID=A0AAD4ES33_9PEZI|nr:hypothetical protein NEMBOFW57_008592 [Staphylotrichum longicolle]
MIETSDSSDLDHLRNLVEALLSVSKTSHNPICQKQLSLFKALHDVAVEYFEVKNAYPTESTAGATQSTLEEANTADIFDCIQTYRLTCAPAPTAYNFLTVQRIPRDSHFTYGTR